uniref:Uncharacterized protein n=1 Tax=Romanomermis culicivorax TaxID=13658 RepID=A0A915L3R3_ROMCU
SSVSSSGAHDAAVPVDDYEPNRDSYINKIDDHPARERDITTSQSKMEYSEIDEVDDRQFQVLKRTTAVVRRTLETASVKDDDQKEQPQKQAPIMPTVVHDSQRTTTDENNSAPNIKTDRHKSEDDGMVRENKADSVDVIKDIKDEISAKKDLETIENTKCDNRNSEKVESKNLSREKRANEPRERRSAFRPKIYINRSSYGNNYYNEKSKTRGERREKYENTSYDGGPLDDEHLDSKIDQERRGPYQIGRSNSRRGQQQQFIRSNSQRRSSYGYNSRNPYNDRFNNERPQMRAYRETHDNYDDYYQSFYYRNDSTREPHNGGYGSRSARGVTSRGSSRRSGMPPRFTTSRKSDKGGEEKNFKQSEKISLENSGERGKPKSDHKNQNDDQSRADDVPSFNHNGKNFHNQSHITSSSIGKNYRHDCQSYNVKSPKTDTHATNQSEGNDEWETASESSDFVGSLFLTRPEKQQSITLRSAGGAFTHRRRGGHNDQFVDGSNNQHENYRRTWNFDNGFGRKPNNRSSGRRVLNNKSARQVVDAEVGLYPACQKVTETGSKNCQVASRSHNNDNNSNVVTQSRSQIQKMHHHNQRMQRRSSSSNAMAMATAVDATKNLQQQTKMRHLQQQTSTKNGAPVQPAVAKKRPSGASSDEKSNGVKLDVLATTLQKSCGFMHQSLILGVVVIDDQPDVGGICDNQDGFQEVMSKKERRNRKELLNNVEIEKRVPVTIHSSKTRENKANSKRQQSLAKIHAHAEISPKKEIRKHENVNSQDKGKIDMWQPVNTKIIDRNEPDSIPNTQKTSKTGVEVWGTPDLAPFSGAVLPSEKPPVLKCVVRTLECLPTKHGDERASIGTPEFSFEAYGVNSDDYATSKRSIENLSEAFDKAVLQATKPDEHRTASVEFVFDTFNGRSNAPYVHRQVRSRLTTKNL